MSTIEILVPYPKCSKHLFGIVKIDSNQSPKMKAEMCVVSAQLYRQSAYTNDHTYRIIHIGLCLSLLIFCQTKSDSQHRFTNLPVKLFSLICSKAEIPWPIQSDRKKCFSWACLTMSEFS